MPDPIIIEPEPIPIPLEKFDPNELRIEHKADNTITVAIYDANKVKHDITTAFRQIQCFLNATGTDSTVLQVGVNGTINQYSFNPTSQIKKIIVPPEVTKQLVAMVG